MQGATGDDDVGFRPGRRGGGALTLPGTNVSPDKTAEPRYQQAEGDDGDAGTTSKGQADDDLQDSIRMTTFTKSPYEGVNSQIDNDLVLEHLKE